MVVFNVMVIFIDNSIVLVNVNAMVIVKVKVSVILQCSCAAKQKIKKIIYHFQEKVGWGT